SSRPAAPSSTCRAAIATTPSMSACACWRCATWSRSATGCIRPSPASACCSPTTPIRWHTCAADDRQALAYLRGLVLRVLREPAVDLGGGDGFLHHVRARPDH